MKKVRLSVAILVVCAAGLQAAKPGPTQAQARSAEPPPLQSEFLMQMTVELGATLMIGETPQGDRRVLPTSGGSFSGPKLKGQVLSDGADWLLFRKDGAAQQDVRLTLRTDDGALMYVSYRGVSVIPPEVRQRIMNGDAVDASEYYFRTTPYFETGSEKYSWLNKIVAVGVGKRNKSSVVYNIYAIK